jgi:hypothetical protein
MASVRDGGAERDQEPLLRHMPCMSSWKRRELIARARDGKRKRPIAWVLARSQRDVTS